MRGSQNNLLYQKKRNQNFDPVLVALVKKIKDRNFDDAFGKLQYKNEYTNADKKILRELAKVAISDYYSSQFANKYDDLEGELKNHQEEILLLVKEEEDFLKTTFQQGKFPIEHYSPKKLKTPVWSSQMFFLSTLGPVAEKRKNYLIQNQRNSLEFLEENINIDHSQVKDILLQTTKGFYYKDEAYSENSIKNYGREIWRMYSLIETHDDQIVLAKGQPASYENNYKPQSTGKYHLRSDTNADKTICGREIKDTWEKRCLRGMFHENKEESKAYKSFSSCSKCRKKGQHLPSCNEPLRHFYLTDKEEEILFTGAKDKLKDLIINKEKNLKKRRDTASMFPKQKGISYFRDEDHSYYQEEMRKFMCSSLKEIMISKLEKEKETKDLFHFKTRQYCKDRNIDLNQTFSKQEVIQIIKETLPGYQDNSHGYLYGVRGALGEATQKLLVNKGYDNLPTFNYYD